VEVTAIPAPPESPKNMKACFKKVFEHEVSNNKAIYKLVKMSQEKEDWATWNFMQWFVKEQVEEETLAMNLLDKIKIAGGEKMSSDAMYSFDRDMEKTSDDATLAREVTTENP